jgi:hypothetical protein
LDQGVMTIHIHISSSGSMLLLLQIDSELSLGGGMGGWEAALWRCTSTRAPSPSSRAARRCWTASGGARPPRPSAPPLSYEPGGGRRVVRARVQYAVERAFGRAQSADESTGAYRQVIRINPKHAWALYNLGVLLQNNRKDIDGAEACRGSVPRGRRGGPEARWRAPQPGPPAPDRAQGHRRRRGGVPRGRRGGPEARQCT